MHHPETTATVARRWTRLAAVITSLLAVAAIAVPAQAAPPLRTAAGDTPVTVSAPATVRSGSTITAKVTTESGHSGTATVWYRTDDVWKKSSVRATITNGVGNARWAASSSRQYRVELNTGEFSAPFAISVQDGSARAITGWFSAADFVSGEIVWIRGTAYRSGKAYSGATVTVERKKNGTTSWSTVWTTKTSSAGSFNYPFSPSSLYTYRARIKGTSAVSGPMTITGSAADRTLEERAANLAGMLGSASGSIRDVAEGDLSSGVISARYRHYAKGTLVEVTRSSGVRTWLTTGRIGDRYEALGYWEGRLGLPLKDMRCGLLEKGCVQRFVGGALYINGSSMSPKVYSAYGSVEETEILAAAYSQVGYEEPSWRVNKYTAWLGSRPAWCMTFTAWAAAASGHASWVPNKGSYASYVSTLQKSGRLNYSGTPPVGAALLLDWGTGTPTHSALLTSRSGGSIRTLEGNTTDGTGDPQRGVYHRTRALSDVWAWYMPSE